MRGFDVTQKLKCEIGSCRIAAKDNIRGVDLKV